MANASRQYCDFGNVKEQLGLEHILGVGEWVREGQGCKAFIKLDAEGDQQKGCVSVDASGCFAVLAAARLCFWVRAGLVV